MSIICDRRGRRSKGKCLRNSQHSRKRDTNACKALRPTVRHHIVDIYLDRARRATASRNWDPASSSSSRTKSILSSRLGRAYPRNTRPDHKLLIYNLLANPFCTRGILHGQCWFVLLLNAPPSAENCGGLKEWRESSIPNPYRDSGIAFSARRSGFQGARRRIWTVA